jgi:hypothetical protein
VFVTSTTRDATSANIADYNQFVTNAAQAVPELAALNTNWFVLGETDTVTFPQNTGFTFNFTFRLDGRFVAGATVNFYIGPLSSPITIDETGSPTSGLLIWTGLGSGKLGDTQVTLGNPDGGCVPCWGLNDGLGPNTDQHSLYAISDVLIAPTPEPGSIGLIAIGVVAIWQTRRRVRSSR